MMARSLRNEPMECCDLLRAQTLVRCHRNVLQRGPDKDLSMTRLRAI